MEISSCQRCGTRFQKRARNHVYCSPGCRGYQKLPPRSLNCAVCSAPLSGEQMARRAKYCSNPCRRKKAHETYAAHNPKPIRCLPTPTVGAMHELLAAYHLMRHGYEVFRAMSPSCTCDLAAFKDGTLVRIEVRTGNRNGKGKLSWGRNKRDDNDYYAVVTHDGAIYIDPPLEGLPPRPPES